MIKARINCVTSVGLPLDMIRVKITVNKYYGELGFLFRFVELPPEVPKRLQLQST